MAGQPKHRGIVIVSKFTEDGKGFGFIEPEGSGSVRDKNVFFSSYATYGVILQPGDEVDFIYSNQPKEDAGPRAFRVYVTKRVSEEGKPT